MSYTTVSNVSAELNGFVIDASSTPNSTTVETWIKESDREIDLSTGRIWSSTTVSSELYDYDGSGELILDKSPIISITKLETERNGINGTSENWETLEEGRTSTKDFIVYDKEGLIEFHGTSLPYAGDLNMRVTYVAGYETTPYDIQRLSTLMTARRLIGAVQSASATNEGGRVSVGTISVDDPTQFGNTRLREISTDINNILSKIGTFKTYKIRRRYPR